jgi:hypothetical protein
MAEEVQIQGVQSTAKLRNPLGVIGLTLITFGIYGIFWYYFVNREMADFGRARGTTELGDSPGTSVLAVTLGALVIVPAILSLYNTCKRVEATQRLAGDPNPTAAGLLFVLYIFISPVALYLIQDGLNKAWQAQASSGGGAQLPPQQAAAPPAPEQPAPAAAAPEQPAAAPEVPPQQ